MAAKVESTTRGLTDYFHFGIIFLGILFLAAGVVIVSVRTVILGLALIMLGMAFFLLHSCDED